MVTRVLLVLPKVTYTTASPVSVNETGITYVSPVRTTDPYPLVEVVEGTAGPKPVIRGTRVSVRAIVRYVRMGLTPENIVSHVLPSLSLSQIRDALLYYRHHQTEIDRDIQRNNEEADGQMPSNNLTR